MSAVLPPGMDPAGFSAAMRAIAEEIGSEWVLVTEEELIPYHDAYGFTGLDDHTPGAAVSPADVEQLRAVMRIANEHGLPKEADPNAPRSIRCNGNLFLPWSSMQHCDPAGEIA